MQAYGVVLLLAAAGFALLQRALIVIEGPGSALAAAVGRDIKGKASPVLYLAGILLTFVDPWFGVVAYVVVALIWLVPDPRLERQLVADAAGRPGEPVHDD